MADCVAARSRRTRGSSSARRCLRRRWQLRVGISAPSAVALQWLWLLLLVVGLASCGVLAAGTAAASTLTHFRVASTDSWRQGQLDRLKFWLLKHGATFPKLDVAVLQALPANGTRVAGEDACGAYALEDIVRGETILFVPDHLMITPTSVQLHEPTVLNMSKAASEMQHLDSSSWKVSQHCLLAVAVLEQRFRASRRYSDPVRRGSEVSCAAAASNAGSAARSHSSCGGEHRHSGGDAFFAPYVEALPRSLAHLPAFYRPDEFSHLRGVGLMRSVQASQEIVRQQWHIVQKLYPGFEDRHTFSDFMWAYGNVASRAFTKPTPQHGAEGTTCPNPRLSPGKTEPALVPLLDMLNHRRKPNARWYYDHAREGFALTASQAIAQGTTIHDTYGQRSNQHYLKGYGFLYDGYPVPHQMVQIGRSHGSRSSGDGVNGNFTHEDAAVKADKNHSRAQTDRISVDRSTASTHTHAPEELVLHNVVSLSLPFSALLDVFAWGCDVAPLVAHANDLVAGVGDSSINVAGFDHDGVQQLSWFEWLIHDGLGGGGMAPARKSSDRSSSQSTANLTVDEQGVQLGTPQELCTHTFPTRDAGRKLVDQVAFQLTPVANNSSQGHAAPFEHLSYGRCFRARGRAARRMIVVAKSPLRGPDLKDLSPTQLPRVVAAVRGEIKRVVSSCWTFGLHHVIEELRLWEETRTMQFLKVGTGKLPIPSVAQWTEFSHHQKHVEKRIVRETASMLDMLHTLLRPSEGGDIAPLTPPMPHPLLVKEVMITIGMPVSMINDAFHNSSWAQSHALVMRSVLDRIENRYGSFGNEEVSHENSIGEDSADKDAGRQQSASTDVLRSDGQAEDEQGIGTAKADFKFVLPRGLRLKRPFLDSKTPRLSTTNSYEMRSTIGRGAVQNYSSAHCDPLQGAPTAAFLGLPFNIVEYSFSDVMNRIVKDALDVMKVAPAAFSAEAESRAEELRMASGMLIASATRAESDGGSPWTDGGMQGPSGQGWEIFWDSETGRWYEFCAATGQSVWVSKGQTRIKAALLEKDAALAHAHLQQQCRFANASSTMATLLNAMATTAWSNASISAKATSAIEEAEGDLSSAKLDNRINIVLGRLSIDLFAAHILASAVRRSTAEFSSSLEENTLLLIAAECARFDEASNGNCSESLEYYDHTLEAITADINRILPTDQRKNFSLSMNHENIIRLRHGEQAGLRLLHDGASAAVSALLVNSTASLARLLAMPDSESTPGADATHETLGGRQNSVAVLGRRVKGRWRGGPHWYPGTVTAVLPLRQSHGHSETQTVDILYDDGDSELAVPAVPELVIPYDGQLGEGVQGLLRLNRTVGDMCHKMQLLQCASQVLVRQDANSVHVPGQHQRLQGVSFFPVNTVIQRLPDAKIARFLCGNATGVLATVEKATSPPSPPLSNSTDVFERDQWMNRSDAIAMGLSSLFHQHLSDRFDLLGTYAAGYVQMAHVPPPYLQPCTAGEKVTAIWAPYSVPLPAVIQTVNRGNLFMHSPVHKWGHASAGGVYRPFTVTLKWDDGDTSSRTVPAHAVFGERDGLSCAAREGLAPFTAYGVSNQTVRHRDGRSNFVVVDVADHCTLVYTVEQGQAFGVRFQASSSPTPNENLCRNDSDVNGTSNTIAAGLPNLLYPRQLAQSRRGTLALAVLTSGRVVTLPSPDDGAGLNSANFGRVMKFVCPAALARTKTQPADLVNDILSRASTAAGFSNASSSEQHLAGNISSLKALLERLAAQAMGADSSDTHDTADVLSGVARAHTATPSMSLREYYWTEWFNVDRPEVHSGFAEAQTRSATLLTHTRHVSCDNETLQAIRDPKYRHMLPPVSVVAQVILAHQSKGHAVYSDAFVPPCGGTLVEPIVPLEVQCQVESDPTDWNPSIHWQMHESQRSQPVEFCSPSAGLLCAAYSSSDYPCNDYRVRYMCPRPTGAGDALSKPDVQAPQSEQSSVQVRFPYWTPWLNRDSPQHSGGNDNELLLDFQMASGIDPCSATAPWVPGTLNANDFFRMHSEMDDPLAAYEPPPFPNGSAAFESDGVAETRWRFLASVGQRVEARWRGRQHWYPGTITKVLEAPRTSGVLVDILYEDGDVERGVPADRLRPHHGTRPPPPQGRRIHRGQNINDATWLAVHHHLPHRVPLAADCRRAVVRRDSVPANSTAGAPLDGIVRVACGSRGRKCTAAPSSQGGGHGQACQNYEVRFLCPPLHQESLTTANGGGSAKDRVTQFIAFDRQRSASLPIVGVNLNWSHGAQIVRASNWDDATFGSTMPLIAWLAFDNATTLTRGHRKSSVVLDAGQARQLVKLKIIDQSGREAHGNGTVNLRWGRRGSRVQNARTALFSPNGFSRDALVLAKTNGTGGRDAFVVSSGFHIERLAGFLTAVPTGVTETTVDALLVSFWMKSVVHGGHCNLFANSSIQLFETSFLGQSSPLLQLTLTAIAAESVQDMNGAIANSQRKGCSGFSILSAAPAVNGRNSGTVITAPFGEWQNIAVLVSALPLEDCLHQSPTRFETATLHCISARVIMQNQSCTFVKAGLIPTMCQNRSIWVRQAISTPLSSLRLRVQHTPGVVVAEPGEVNAWNYQTNHYKQSAHTEVSQSAPTLTLLIDELSVREGTHVNGLQIPSSGTLHQLKLNETTPESTIPHFPFDAVGQILSGSRVSHLQIHFESSARAILFLEGRGGCHSIGFLEALQWNDLMNIADRGSNFSSYVRRWRNNSCGIPELVGIRGQVTGWLPSMWNESVGTLSSPYFRVVGHVYFLHNDSVSTENETALFQANVPIPIVDWWRIPGMSSSRARTNAYAEAGAMSTAAGCSFSDSAEGYSPGPAIELRLGAESLAACQRWCCATESCRSVAFTPTLDGVASPTFGISAKEKDDSLHNNECWLLPRDFHETFYPTHKFHSIPHHDNISGIRKDLRSSAYKELLSIMGRPYLLSARCEVSGGAACRASALSCESIGWPMAFAVALHETRHEFINGETASSWRVVAPHPLLFRSVPGFDAPPVLVDDGTRPLLAMPGQVVHSSQFSREPVEAKPGPQIVWVQIRNAGWLPTMVNDSHSRHPNRGGSGIGADANSEDATNISVALRLLAGSRDVSNESSRTEWVSQTSTFCVNADLPMVPDFAGATATPHCQSILEQGLVQWQQAAQYCTNWVGPLSWRQRQLQNSTPLTSKSPPRRGGARLCSASELLALGHARVSCPSTDAYSWTSTPCGPGAHLAVRQFSAFNPRSSDVVCVNDDHDIRSQSSSFQRILAGRCCADEIPLAANAAALTDTGGFTFPTGIVVPAPSLPASEGDSQRPPVLTFRRSLRINIPSSVPLCEDLEPLAQPCTRQAPCTIEQCLSHCAANTTASLVLPHDRMAVDGAFQVPAPLSTNCQVGWRAMAQYAGNMQWYPATIAAIDAHTGQLTVNWDDGDSSFREIPALEGVPAVRSCRPPTPLSPNVDFAVADDSLVESTCVESRAYQNGQDCSAINNISGLSAAGNFSQQCQAAFSHFSGVCKLYKSVCTTNHTAGSDAHAAVYLLSNMSPDTSQSETIESSNVRSDSNISSAEQVAQIQNLLMDLLSETPAPTSEARQQHSENPLEQVLVFEILGVDGTSHQFPLGQSSHSSRSHNDKPFAFGPPEVALATGIDLIGYSRRHLSSRSDRLGQRVKKHVDFLLSVLKKRSTDRLRNASSANSLPAIENKSAARYRNVSLDSPGDIYAFIEENVGIAALQESVESRPLKVHNPSFTLEVVPAAGRQILNPITDFVGAQSASFAIALDVSMRDIMLTVTAMLDILCGKYIGGMHASVARSFALQNVTTIPANVLLARAAHATHYVPQSERLRSQHRSQGRQSLKSRDWSLWGTRSSECLAVHKLRALPDDLYDYLSLEAVMTSAQASTASSHNDRIWRQFKLTPALCDEALRYFPTLNVSAVHVLRERLKDGVATVLIDSPEWFERDGLTFHGSFFAYFTKMLELPKA